MIPTTFLKSDSKLYLGGDKAIICEFLRSHPDINKSLRSGRLNCWKEPNSQLSQKCHEIIFISQRFLNVINDSIIEYKRHEL